jgi:pimeloyl-ACP methyl ester carboxylesterase
MIMFQQSLYLSQNNHTLHIRNINTSTNGIPVLMFHGSIENGKIFYTESGKGFACYLAEQGFDVYVVDFRGRGASTPAISGDSNFGQHETIVQDIPALIEYVYGLTKQPMHVVCHSWGGVLFGSALARFPALLPHIRAQVCFGTKRRVTVWNMERFLKVSLVWSLFTPLVTKRTGYLNAVKFGIGSDNETHQSILESLDWIKSSKWIDPIDNFDYGHAAKEIEWPQSWHITGVKDFALGHAQDVKLFINESCKHATRFSNLSKKAGYKVDYDHINILTHPDAPKDHFPEIVDWLKQH